MNEMRRALIAGCGFTGEAVARLLVAAGWEVTGVTHSGESAARLSIPGLRAIACDIADAAAVTAKLGPPGGFDALVDCVSSGRGGVDAYRRNYLEGAQILLAALRPRTFLFTGSTSVYAQNDGSWVTEESAANPVRETGKILRETEDLVLSQGGIVARLAGIYGPGRWAPVRKFLDGTAVTEGDGGRWINQIHRDDAATAILILLNKATGPGIYNVSDGNPITQIEFHQILAAHFQKPLPSRGETDPNRKRGVSSKRVDAGKLRALGWKPHYSSIRVALESWPDPGAPS